MIYLVSGFGRCGSSMVMQMLVAGGLEPGCAIPPLFEDRRATGSDPYGEWTKEYHGKCLKWIDPVNFPPPCDIAPIWLDRDPKEQAKSWCKYFREKPKRGWAIAHKGSQRANRGRFSKMFKEHRGTALRALSKQAAIPVYAASYESILADPEHFSVSICHHWGLLLDIDSMCSVVMQRSPKCHKDWLEDQVTRLWRARQ